LKVGDLSLRGEPYSRGIEIASFETRYKDCSPRLYLIVLRVEACVALGKEHGALGGLLARGSLVYGVGRPEGCFSRVSLESKIGSLSLFVKKTRRTELRGVRSLHVRASPPHRRNRAVAGCSLEHQSSERNDGRVFVLLITGERRFVDGLSSWG